MSMTVSGPPWIVNIPVPVSGAGKLGYRAFMFGDSMVDLHEAGGTIISGTYNQSTGVITVVETGHGHWTGKLVRFWNYNYPSIRDMRISTMTRIDANTWAITLADRPQDIPNGAMAASLFFNPAGPMSYTHWFGQLQLRTGHRFTVVKNAAQSGDTSEGCLRRFDAAYAGADADLIIMQLPGLNDVAPVNGVPEATTIANNRALIDKCLATKAMLWLLTTTPVVTGEARATPLNMQRIININRDAVQYCRGKSNVLLMDAYGKIINPTDVGGYATAANLKADKVHYSYTGSALLVPDAELILNSRFPTLQSTLPQSTLDCHTNSKLTVSSMSRAADGVTVTVNSTAHGYRVGEEFGAYKLTPATENGVFVVASVPTANSFTYVAAGSVGAIGAGAAVITKSKNAWNNPVLGTATGGTLGGGATGTVAALLNASVTGTSIGTTSVVAAPAGGLGNEQVTVCTTGVVGDRISFTVTGSSALKDDVLPNRYYSMECRLRIASSNWALANISELFPKVDFTWSTGEIYSAYMSGGWDGTEVTFKADQTLHLKTSPAVPLTPPQAGATITNVSFTVYVKVGTAFSAGPTLTVALSQIAFWDVT